MLRVLEASRAVGRSIQQFDARILLMHVLKRSRAWLIAHDEYELSTDEESAFLALVARREKGEPIAYLVGERDFYGRTFRTTPAALIPRPETEHLIERALALLKNISAPNILDVGTGTGCIALTLALERPDAHVVALDISTSALELARENAHRLGANNVRFVESNWFSALDEGAQFDAIVSNPPYIVPGDKHLTEGDLRFEPSLALADAVDGLESYRELIAGAKKHLVPNGALIVEHGYDQGHGHIEGGVPALFRKAGFESVEMTLDLAGLPRITLAKGFCNN